MQDTNIRRLELGEVLTHLLNKRLWGLGFAADLLWLQFGEPRTLTSVTGRKRQVGEWALHVTCRWYFRAPGFDVDSRTQSIEGIKLAAIRILTEQLPREVRLISVRDRGGFCLELSNGGQFEVFPKGAEEQWRLFRPGTGEKHWVFAEALKHI